MKKMEQTEFDRMTFSKSPKDCNHPDVVRIYDSGTHIDYGCVVCGFTHTNKEAFDKKETECNHGSNNRL